MLLTDILMAIAQNTSPNYSTNEIDIKMPSAAHSFRSIYNSLLHGFPLPPDLSNQEDALLLLVALFADIIYYQSAFRSRTVLDKAEGRAWNYDSLSRDSEYLRLYEAFGSALSRWKRYFEQYSSDDMLVLYRFARMRLVAAETITYRNIVATYTAFSEKPSDEAITLAWEVLDLMENVLEDHTQRMSMWLPLAIFASAVVIWKGLLLNKESMGKHSRLKMLSMFKEKLVELPWPCCSRMIADLERMTNLSGVG